MTDPKDLLIDETQLDRELAEQAAKYIYVAQQAVNAEYEWRTFQLQLDELEAALGAKARLACKANGEKPTEKLLSEMLAQEPDYRKGQRYLLQLWKEKEDLKAQEKAWFQRKDMLVQIACKQRSEIESLARSTVKVSDEAA